MIGIPSAILYSLQGRIRIDEEVEEPNRFLEEFRAGEYTAC